ncbi:MAG: pseudouridylate synthase, partial [Candidatus Thiodiazotropha sp. (ex Notomyrtea botanica)]|nr:pseudouridylate synthase [Candidatus Thiodiazotropha sp. (ex Notomyrtea botanica)]
DRRARKSKPPQPAITKYHRLATLDLPFCVDRYPTSRYSLVKINPLTGRKHQIRRHFKHLSHPIIGDTSYGKTSHNRFFAEQFGCRRLLLAATQMEIMHPVIGEPLVLEAALDNVFRKIEGLFINQAT